MARTGRRKTRRKLEPLIPEAPDELTLPKYFNMIRSGGYRGAKDGELRREEMLPPMSMPDETPKALRTRRPLLPRDPFPNSAPESEKMPLLARLKYHFVSLFKVEPERPMPMPTVPELNFPALYTRFPVMKTVTKVTDSAGKIQVDFSNAFQEIPVVVMTVKGEEAWSGNVFDVSLTYFKAIFFKAAHDHGGVVDDGGAHDHTGNVDDGGAHDHGGVVDDGGAHDHTGNVDDGGAHDHGGIVDDGGAHTPTINADGNHMHNVQGTGNLSLDTNYGRLVMSNYTDYETNHVHTQVQTQLESAHVHGMYPTSSAGSHSHTNPGTSYIGAHIHGVGSTGGPSSNASGLIPPLYMGTNCTSGRCVTGVYSGSFATSSHTHSNPNTGANGGHDHSIGNTGSGGAHTHPNISTKPTSHRHLLNSTGAAPSPGHRHLISDSALYNHYVYDVGLTLNLVASSYENPYHGHSGGYISPHDHILAEQLAHLHGVVNETAHDHVVAGQSAHLHGVVNETAHDHVVALDGGLLLKNTTVTITYIAQVES